MKEGNVRRSFGVVQSTLFLPVDSRSTGELTRWDRLRLNVPNCGKNLLVELLDLSCRPCQSRRQPVFTTLEVFSALLNGNAQLADKEDRR